MFFRSISAKSSWEFDLNRIFTLPGLAFNAGIGVIIAIIAMVLYCNLLDVKFYVRSGFQELTATVMDQVAGQNVLNAHIDNVVDDADDRAEVRVVAVVSKSCPL